VHLQVQLRQRAVGSSVVLLVVAWLVVAWLVVAVSE
jgi:hypothetical protein